MTIRLDQFLGIDNKHAPEALFAIERGRARTALVEATNVDLTDAGKLKRRQGFTQLLSGSWHSLWGAPSGQRGFGVKDGVLQSVGADLNATPLSVSLGERRTVFAEIPSGDVHLSDGRGHWVYSAGTMVHLARAGSYERSDQYLDQSEDEAFHDSFPAANELLWAFGRLWGADDLALWYSPPFYPRRCRLDEDFIPFAGTTLLQAVADGIYLGNDTEVWFFGGKDPKAMQPRQVMDCGAVKGTALPVLAERFKAQSKGPAAIWESSRGKMLGLAGGQVVPLTEENLSYGTGETGASLLKEAQGLTQHLSVFRQPGDGSNMRTADIAVAEVRRKGIII
jgi:hypothetical protein